MATFETAEDRYVAVDGIRFAYRRLGAHDGVPLVLLNPFRGTMDHWDPALVNALAARRPVVLVDGAGVGRSAGAVPETVAAWARHYAAVLRALGIARADLLGSSMGGCAAQMVALDAPALARCLVLRGTIPGAGPGVTRAPLAPFNRLKAAATPAELRDAFLAAFFTPSARGQAAGRASWDRIRNARPHPPDQVTPESAHRQAVAFAKFMDPKQAKDSSYDRLHELELPVLIASGSEDLLLPTDNSILLWKKLSHANAQLHLYPDSGHGFLYQNAAPFAALVNDFLDSAGAPSSRL